MRSASCDPASNRPRRAQVSGERALRFRARGRDPWPARGRRQHAIHAGVGLLAAFAAIALVPSALGYELQEDGAGHPLYWKSMPVRYSMVTGNAPDGPAGEAAVHRAFDTWSAASTNVEYVFDGFMAEGEQRNDGRNLVFWVHDSWPYDPRLAAVTFHYFDTRDGHLLDSDIVFNGALYSWSAGGGGYDVENSATHEVGHFGGLGHSSDTAATMFAKTAASEVKKRTLEGDDIAGLDALYGGGPADELGGQGVAGRGSNGVGGSGGGGGCSVGRADGERGGSEAAWLALLLGAMSLNRRRSRTALRRRILAERQ